MKKNMKKIIGLGTTLGIASIAMIPMLSDQNISQPVVLDTTTDQISTQKVKHTEGSLSSRTTVRYQIDHNGIFDFHMTAKTRDHRVFFDETGIENEVKISLHNADDSAVVRLDQNTHFTMAINNRNLTIDINDLDIHNLDPSFDLTQNLRINFEIKIKHTDERYET
jgi:hypothetical protein